MRVRFHLDEHVSGAIAAGLRRRNIDVTTSADASLLGADDIDHVSFARSANRVLFTQDDDYLVLHSQGVPHAGIVYCRQGMGSVGDIIRRLALIHEVLVPEDLDGRIEFL